MWAQNKRKDKLIDADNFTVLGKDVTFKGVAHFEGTVQIESRFEGEIHTEGTLVVGEHAVIRGTITAGTLISGGNIQGNVSATEKVRLLKSAVQIGDVHAPAFSVEEGAYFKGFADTGVRRADDKSSRDREGESAGLAEPDDQHPCLMGSDHGN